MKKRQGAKAARMARLMRLARTQTIGQFLKGHTIWPRSEMTNILSARRKRVSEMDEGEAEGAACALSMLAFLAARDGRQRTAERLRALSAVLDEAKAVEWVVPKRSVDETSLEMARIFEVQRLAMKEARRRHLPWKEVLGWGFPVTPADLEAVRL